MSSDHRLPYPSPAHAWSFVFVLFVASIASVIDRAVLNIVVDPLRRDIGLTDVQIALLQGLAFGLFYAAVGLLLGLTADRYSRRRLILIGMSLWSCATVAAGFVHSFGSLFLSRILVGLGEAALGPAAISLIADLFPPDKRGRPISFFLMGQAVAVGLSISIAGLILQAVQAGRFDRLPVLGGLAPWRAVFVCCGGAGAAVLAMLVLMREPYRQTAHQPGNFRAQATRCVAYLVRNRAVLLPFYLGFACVFAAAYGAGAWMPTMLVRKFGITNMQFGRWLGPLSLVLGVIGPMIGGLIADYQTRTRRYAARLLVLSAAPLLALPSALAGFAPGLRSAIVLVAAITAVTALIGTMTFAALQSMVPGHMRGIAIALTGLINTVIGATSGPLLVAEFTQRLYRNPDLVGYSIATLAVPALGLAAICFACSWIALRRQVASHGEVATLLDIPSRCDEVVKRNMLKVFILGAGAACVSCFAHSAGATGAGDGLAHARDMIEQHRSPPIFTAQGAPFDARQCAAGKKMLSIPNNSGNPFLKGIIEREILAGKEVGLTVQEWQNQGQPSQWTQGVQYALRNHFDWIDLISGIDPKGLEPALRTAAAAGVKTMTSHFYDPSQPVDPLVAVSLPVSFYSVGKLLADWVILRMDGKANVVIVESDEVPPTGPLVRGIQEELAAYCPGCRIIQRINVGSSEWAAKIQPSVQAAVLAHPEVNFVIPIYDSMSQFVVPAIQLTHKQAGVKIATFNGTPFALDYVREGKIDMDLGESLDWIARATIDGYLRGLCGQPVPKNIGVPFYVFDARNAGDAGIPAKFDQGYGSDYVRGFHAAWMLQRVQP